MKVNDDDMVSLTDLWKAAGSKPANKPVEWLRSESTKDFINEIKVSGKGGNSHLIDIRRGRGDLGGGTWADVQH
ncbi:MAG: KilA-N domain-containing protein [Desulfovibrionaceae bacterium]|nr:KilA-N domain-containing protein [Desulfovibrionaceae bacterium]